MNEWHPPLPNPWENGPPQFNYKKGQNKVALPPISYYLPINHFLANQQAKTLDIFWVFFHPMGLALAPTFSHKSPWENGPLQFNYSK
jgi:hypothetical protein